MQSAINEQLAQQNIAVQSINLSLFSPALSLENIKTTQFSAQKLKLNLVFASFVWKHSTSFTEYSTAQINSKHTKSCQCIDRGFAFFIKTAFIKKVILNGENHIRIEFNKPIYGKTKTFHFLSIKRI